MIAFQRTLILRPKISFLNRKYYEVILELNKRVDLARASLKYRTYRTGSCGHILHSQSKGHKSTTFKLKCCVWVEVSHHSILFGPCPFDIRAINVSGYAQPPPGQKN